MLLHIAQHCVAQFVSDRLSFLFIITSQMPDQLFFALKLKRFPGDQPSNSDTVVLCCRCWASTDDICGT